MIRFYNAGAGSGKTYTLSNDLAKFLLEQEGRPAEVILTTFSRKSAEELKERVRKTLLEKGAPAKAAEMSNALIGTVNAVCSQLVSRYAFEIGFPTELKVMDDLSTTVFFDEFLNYAVDHDMFEKLNRSCQLFSAYDSRDEGRPNSRDTLKPSWPGMVKRLASRFRAYAFEQADAERSKEAAVEAARKFLLTRSKYSVKQLWKALEAPMEPPDPKAIKQQDTKKTLPGIEELRRKAGNKEQASWSQFAAAGTELSVSLRKAAPKLNDLVTLCATYHQTTEFAADYIEFIEQLYDTAYSLIKGYQEYKQERGLIDFADQELLFLQMLETNKVVQREIAASFRLVMVDEFQDSSPVQLAIFNKLKELVENSVWVGDPKQAIYGFRDSDAALFNSALEGVAKASPKNIIPLPNSYRSRPAIVDAVNTVFTGMFKGILKKEHIELTASAERKKLEKQANGFDQPAIQLNIHNDTRQENYFASLALYIRNVLQSGRRVYDKKEGGFRAIRGGDIALLFRSNGLVMEMAEQLRAQGIPVSCASEGLQEQAEILWVRCLLRLLINPGDSLAIAQLSILENAFTDVGSMLAARLQYLQEKEPVKKWSAFSAVAKTIEGQYGLFAQMPLVQAVSHLVTASDLPRYCHRWGDAAQRISNVNKVIELAVTYQEQCYVAGHAASFSGFLEHLCNDIQLPPVDSADAVTAMTVHKSKGLEWPMVVLVKLDTPIDDSRVLFNTIHVVPAKKSKAGPLLKGQTIVFLPWPFAATQKIERVSADLAENCAPLDASLQAFNKYRQEEDRLLYVAMTRARDYLVLPYYKKSSGCCIESADRFQASPLFTEEHWEQVKGKATEKPAVMTMGGHKIQVLSVPAFIEELGTNQKASQQDIRYYTAYSRPGDATYGRRYMTPSHSETPETVAVRLLSFRQPLLTLTNLPDTDYALMGNAVHQAFASWNPALEEQERRDRVAGILSRSGLQRHIDAIELETRFGLFSQFITETYSPVLWARELPLSAVTPDNGQVTVGVADLVLQTADGLVLVDHKTFPGHFDSMALELTHEHYAGRYAGQLNHYKAMLEQATGQRVRALLLHYVVQGRLVELSAE
ncbi:MAG: UvrD-helicase domain-containing protein [Candidatus Pseudobacter hemicellulosilyticus]|uniref:DNA 3'-5' helicase n=1 Tax=Candidatus Pseudobacter hemicellulosilyticus TaxID=3121375 RepID=A0AAJ6BFP0_9BACT|nr:MAG: UvrD-helicase domain-containing protein [Pseudobacter sp.]